MAIFLHGTSDENAHNMIKSNKLGKNHKTIWTCSNPNLLYMYNADDEDAIQLSVESGQIAAAYMNSKSTRIAVISLDIPDNIVNELVNPDCSCENTNGCFQINYNDLNNYIKSNIIKAQINYYDNAYIPYLRPFYLSYLNSRYMTISDPLLKIAIKMLKDNDIFIEDILYPPGEKSSIYYDLNKQAYVTT